MILGQNQTCRLMEQIREHRTKPTQVKLINSVNVKKITGKSKLRKEGNLSTSDPGKTGYTPEEECYIYYIVIHTSPIKYIKDLNLKLKC